jgi:hypothetical protein
MPIAKRDIMPQIIKVAVIKPAIPKSMYATFFMDSNFSVNILSTNYINNVLEFWLILKKYSSLKIKTFSNEKLIPHPWRCFVSDSV